jgi:putative membrane protein
MGIVWLVVLVGVVVLLVYLFRGPGFGWRGDEPGGHRPTAREILDQRFARGEITKEQYEDMKRALER